MSNDSTNAQPEPTYRKHPEGGWKARYRGVRLHAMKRLEAKAAEKWAVYEVTGMAPHLKETLLTEGPERGVAVRQAMALVDDRKTAPVQDDVPVVSGVIVSGEVTGHGTLPKYSEDLVVAAAVAAFGKTAGGFGIALAEVTDQHEPSSGVPFPKAARGALVVPAGPVAEGFRVRVYWLEDGQAYRPRDVVSAVPLRIVAGRLADAGFLIESVGELFVTAVDWHETAVAVGAGREELTEMWQVMSMEGDDLAVIEARSADAMLDIAAADSRIKRHLDEGTAVYQRLTRSRVDQWIRAQDPRLLGAVHHCGERGHLKCGSGVELPNTKAAVQGRAMTGAMELLSQGAPQEEQPAPVPTYAQGAKLLGIDGRVHQVFATGWRDFGRRGVVEMVTTVMGQDFPVSDLRLFEGGVRRVETDAHKGDTAAERGLVNRTRLQQVSPSGHREMKTAAYALEAFRTCAHKDRKGWITAAEEAARWAAAKFAAASGELGVDVWRVVVRSGVELGARQIQGDRMHAYDPQPPRMTFFGAGLRTLEGHCPAGWNQVMQAALHWTRSTATAALHWTRVTVTDQDVDRVQTDRCLRAAAAAFAKEFGHQDADQWLTAVLYLAEMHTTTLILEKVR